MRGGEYVTARHVYGAAVLVGVLVADTAWAAGAHSPGAGGGRDPVESDTVLLRSTALFDYRVKSPQGEELGKIEEVIIDMEAGRVAYAVLSFGGFLGLGNKWVPVPWDAVVLRPAEKVLLLNIDTDKLQKAPNFEGTTLPELANRQWGAVIHTYYGYPPYWEKRPYGRKATRVKTNGVSGDVTQAREVACCLPRR